MFSYTFTVLRYVHDITTGEFINVGVVLYSPDALFLRARMRTTFGRLTRLFPDANGEAFKRSLAHVEYSIADYSRRQHDLFPTSGSNAVDFATRVLPRDDSSLQWSRLGSGRSKDLERELDLLFARMVAKYEHKNTESRTEDDVWKSFSRALQNRQVLAHLQYKQITGRADTVTFQHAYKNGIWNCLEPVSFDLVDGERIHTKALRWLGQMTALQGSEDQFKLILLVGEPQNPAVVKHYVRALGILESIPGDKVIYTEAQADELSRVVAEEVLRHQSDEPSHAIDSG